MTFNHRIILKTISIVLFFEGLAMLIPGLSGIYFHEKQAAASLLTIAIMAIIVGISFFLHLRYNTLKIKTREGFFITIVTWFSVCFIGALPFFFSGYDYTFTEALFESTAGWTTTGAWAFNPATSAKSLILWKAICSWMGGIGILLLTISIFPILGIQGQKMVRSEIRGPALEKMSARMSDTAKLSYKIYIVMTLLEFLCLLPSGLPKYEILVNTLFSISTAGILNFNSGLYLAFTPYVQTVFTLFTFLASCNFVIFFFIAIGKWDKIIKNIELRVYIGLLVCSIITMAIMLTISGEYPSFMNALGDSITQAISYSSTSGFKVANTSIWPTACKMILLILVFIGGCSMSTSGSLKVIRVIIFIKLIFRGIYKRIHPRAIKPIMLEGQPVSARSASATAGFILLFFTIFIFSSIVFSVENLDMETTLSIALGTLSNNGTAFGIISNGDYSFLSGISKFYASLLMLTGRLEIIPIIILFSRSFWNSDRARS